MNQGEFLPRLASLFEQQIATAKALHQLMLDENQALLARDYAATQTIVSAKAEKSAELESMATQQRQLLQQHNLSYQPDSFEKLKAVLPAQAAEKFDNLITRLQSALEQCHDQNLINGQIIAINQQSAETALAILRGQTTPNNLAYDAGGKTVGQSKTSTITKA